MDVVPLVGGISADDLGRGFKVNIAMDESAFKGKLFQTGEGKTCKCKNTTTQSTTQMMDSCGAANKHMNIAGFLIGSVGPMVSGESARKYMAKCVKTPRQVCVRYRTVRVHSVTCLRLDQLTPTGEAAESFHTGQVDVEEYGTLFLSQILWGAQLDISFTLTSAEDEDLGKLAASLKAKLEAGHCAGFSASPGNRQLNVEVHAQGVDIQVPSAPSLKQAENIIAEFNAKYDELCRLEDAQWDGSAEHVHLSPIGFTLVKTKHHMDTPTDMEEALEKKMASVAEAFMTASFWIESLKAARKECELEYNRPAERETVVRVHATAVTAELKKLQKKQEDCMAFRNLKLPEILGAPGVAPAAVPVVYPAEGSRDLELLRGLCGRGTLQAPVTLEEGTEPLDYDYEGFLVLGEAARPSDHDCEGFLVVGSDNLRPALKGRLVRMQGHPDAGQVVAEARLPGMLAEQVFVGDHAFDPARLQTSFEESFNPVLGDLLMPDDMHPVLNRTNTEGRRLPPVFKGKKLVLMGPQGSGKTSLFNRLTGSQRRAASVAESVTTEAVSCCAQGPAADLLVVDTPGTANNTQNGMSVKEVVTMRDKVESERRHFRLWAEAARDAFPWIGPVAFIDERVSLGWLYDTVVACAGYFEGTTHFIPLVETFSRFTLTVARLKPDWEDNIALAKLDLSRAMDCALGQIDAAVRGRTADGRAGGSYEDTVASKIDCVVHFMDDLFETTTQRVLADCYETTLDDLWATTDEYELNDRAHTMNAIKVKLAEKLDDVRKRIRDCYPDSGEAAVYKRCPLCKAVYTRPTGCNVLGKCGWKAGVAKDDGHSGRMNVRFLADYEPADPQTQRAAKLTIRERDGDNLDQLEKLALGCRKRVREMAEHLPIHDRSLYGDSAEAEPQSVGTTFGDYGCQADLRWDEMIPLTRAELEHAGLVPPRREQLEPVGHQDPDTMRMESFLRMRCGGDYPKYVELFTECDIFCVADAIKAGRDDLQALLQGSGVPKMKARVLLLKLAELAGEGW